MKNIEYRSKRKLVILIILLSLSLYIFGRYNFDYIFKKNVMSIFDSYFLHTHNFIKETKDIIYSLFNFYKLKHENENLLSNIDELKQQLNEMKEIKIENDKLNMLLDFKSQLKFKTIAAQVIGHDPSNNEKSILLNKGRSDGVLPNHAILCPQGLVGKIVESFDNSSKAMLLVDSDSKIGCMILRTRDLGVLQGQNNNLLIVNYLPRNADVKEKDLVITSGFDGLFPKGIILGEIEKIYAEDFKLYKCAEVTPTVDVNKLEEVLIVKTHLDPKNQ